MAFNLSKAEQSKLTELIQEASDSREKLITEIQEFDEELSRLFEEKFNDLIAEFNSNLASINDFAVGIKDNMQAEFDDKSDQWKEGGRGLEVAAIIEEWDEFSDQLGERLELEYEFSFNVDNDDIINVADIVPTSE